MLKPATGGYYKPLSMTSLMLDRARAADAQDMRPFRRTSLALHVANVLLIFALLRLLFASDWAAAGAALLFAVHPVMVEALPWAAERKNLLASSFGLGALLLWVLHARRRHWGYYAGSVLLFALGLLSKPIVIPLPAMLLLLDYWPLRRLTGRSVPRVLPYGALAAAFALITYLSQTGGPEMRLPVDAVPMRGLLTAYHNVIFHLAKLIWPANLSPYYAYPSDFSLRDPAIVAGVVGTPVLLVLLLISWRWTRAILVGGLVFLVAILPTLGIIRFTDVITADRFVYFPAIGFLLIIAWGLARLFQSQRNGATALEHRCATALEQCASDRARLPNRSTAVRRRLIAGTLVLLLAAAESYATRSYLRDWQDSVRLYSRAVRLAPDAPVPHNSLGTALRAAGRTSDAVAEFRRALELLPGYATAHFNLGVALNELGQHDEARQHLDLAAQYGTRSYQAAYNLGVAAEARGDLTEALAQYRRAIGMHPDYVEAHNNLGGLLIQTGEVTEGIEHCRRAATLRPGFAEAHQNLGIGYARGNNLEAALQELQLAVRLKPDLAAAYNSLGTTLARMSRFTEARDALRQAIHLQPDYATPYFNLSGVQQALGDPAAALASCEAAVRLRPDYVAAHFRLGQLYREAARPDDAVREFRRVLELQADHGGALRELDELTSGR